MAGTIRTESPLVTYLRERGIVLAWLARKLGVSSATFTRREQGVQSVPPGYYERVAAILGCSPETIRRPFDPSAPVWGQRRRRRRKSTRKAKAAA